MPKPLVREVQTRSTMVIRHLPLLARLYRYAFHQRASRKKELFVHVPLQKLFRLCHSWIRRPKWGIFSYERLGVTQTIRFDARNLQFFALYGPIHEHGYEQEVCTLLDLFLPEGGTLCDIGSNWGYCSLHAASRHHQLTVHAFEPHPRTFQDLTACVEQAGLGRMVTCHNLALSDQDAEAHIEFPDGLHSGSAEVNMNARGIRTTLRRLDGLKLPRPDALKIDAEEHEFAVLQGARRTIESSHPLILMESKRRFGVAAAVLKPLQYLVDLGYELYMPAVGRSAEGIEYFVASGCLLDSGKIQWIEAVDCLALIRFEPDERFLLQPDINVFAWHASRKEELLAKFKEAP